MSHTLPEDDEPVVPSPELAQALEGIENEEIVRLLALIDYAVLKSLRAQVHDHHRVLYLGSDGLGRDSVIMLIQHHDKEIREMKEKKSFTSDPLGWIQDAAREAVNSQRWGRWITAALLALVFYGIWKYFLSDEAVVMWMRVMAQELARPLPVAPDSGAASAIKDTLAAKP